MNRKCIALALAIPLFVAGAASADEPRPKSIKVSGEAVVRVDPDQATLTLSVGTVDPAVATARSRHRELLDKVLASLREKSADPTAIKLGRVGLSNFYDQESKAYRFAANASISVRTKDLAGINDMITAAVEAGATGIEGVVYESSDYKERREEARRDALVAAREKATRMADTLDERIGRPISIIEDYTSSDGGPGGANRATYTNVATEPWFPAPGTGSADAFELGQVTYRASVTVEFELAPK